jgi:hypothetical protein
MIEHSSSPPGLGLVATIGRDPASLRAEVAFEEERPA